MRRQGGRASFWRLLLPFPIAALTVGIVGAAAQRPWHGNGSGQRIMVSNPDVTQTATIGDEVAAVQTEPAVVPGDSGAARAVSTESLELGHYYGRSTSSAFAHTFGPAPEPVAPSSEVAPHASEPPPAVVSAPRLAPAPNAIFALAPEPQMAPTAAPPQFVQPRASSRDKRTSAHSQKPSEQLTQAWAQQNVRSVRFDSGYYYGSGMSVSQLADKLTSSWQAKGVNLIYFYAYNRVYGARYRTSYPGNIMEDFGRQDLLRYVLDSAHARGMKVVAWFYGPQHKQMWEAHPTWREKMANGRDYMPTGDSYLLCVRNPEVTRWWLGLIDDILINYPDLDGLDVSEAQVDTWGDNACYCRTCKSQFAVEYPRKRTNSTYWHQFRADGLTRLLLATSHLARDRGKQFHLTTVFTARADGTLMPSADVRDATGFDLNAILASVDRPDVIQAELIWQQWAAVYGDRVTFTPDWTRQAVLQAKNMIAGKSALIAHLEVTDFGSGGLDGPKIGTTVASAVAGDPFGIDIYDAHLIDQVADASGYLQTAWLNF